MDTCRFSFVWETKVLGECKNLANHLGLKDCSMGMSNDWQEAIEAGATWIRLGSLLFGKRQTW